MASSLPAGALGNLATSLKNIVSQPTEDATVASKTEVSTKETAVAPDAKVSVESHNDGTTVHKEKAVAVEHETVKPSEHEQVETVVDKEVHQDHYHRTIQPVKDKNVLPTKHTYKDNESEREFDHRDDTAAKEVEQEAKAFHDEKVVQSTKHTKEVAPTKKDEHVHHHFHEVIQPVIERETIQPEVVHIKNHVHETHHLKAEHQEATTAPAISLSDFEKKAGTQKEVSAVKETETAAVKPKEETTTAVTAKEDTKAVTAKEKTTAVKEKDTTASKAALSSEVK